MPIITERLDYNGFNEKVRRLGLVDLVAEVESVIEGFQLLVEEKKYANGTKGLRETIDKRFTALGSWEKLTVGGIDWTKENENGSKIGVEVQVSGRSDMLAVDVIHLREELVGGRLEAGIIIVPDNRLSYFLTDRTPNLKTAIRHIENRAKDLAVRLIAFQHNGIGPALPKVRTNLGRK